MSLEVGKIQVCREAGIDPAIFSLVTGDSTIGTLLAEDRRVPLVSATGSTRMGKMVANAVAKRLGRTLLELGGNNALIVTPSADFALALRALLFGAGTAGQRCATTPPYRPRIDQGQVAAKAGVRLQSHSHWESSSSRKIPFAQGGSDCGIANVNLGTSGAEIGGAFGGEKETVGGRESGSDAWKVYMCRQTVTINYGADLPLAQGIRFE